MKSRLSFLILLCVSASMSVPILAADDSSTVEKKSTKNVDPTGTWRWEYDWQDRKVKEAFRINLTPKGKLVGKLHRNENTVLEISDGKINGDQISFSVTTSLQGVDYVANYAGKIVDDNLEGSVSLEAGGQSHKWPFTPKRSVQFEDVVGKWQFRIEARGNVFEPRLTVSPDGNEFKAEYESPLLSDDEQPTVEGLRIEENELHFTIDVTYQGTNMNLDYKGRPYGDRIKGIIDVNNGTAELEFEAKRTADKK